MYNSSSDDEGDEDKGVASGESNGLVRPLVAGPSETGTIPFGCSARRLEASFTCFEVNEPGTSHHALSSVLGGGTINKAISQVTLAMNRDTYAPTRPALM